MWYNILYKIAKSYLITIMHVVALLSEMIKVFRILEDISSHLPAGLELLSSFSHKPMNPEMWWSSLWMTVVLVKRSLKGMHFLHVIFYYKHTIGMYTLISCWLQTVKEFKSHISYAVFSSNGSAQLLIMKDTAKRKDITLI